MAAIKRKSWFAYLAFPLFIALVLASVLAFRERFVSVFQDREAIRTWVEGRGAWAPLVFMGLQVLQVVVFVVPGEIVQIAGGYVFGFWIGTLYSIIGLCVGSALNFWVGRALGRPFVESIFSSEKVEEIERTTGKGRGAAAFFLLFAIPGLPKDILCYVGGISRLNFAGFMAISMLGRLPGVLGSSFMGSAAYEGSYRAALAVLAVASVLFFLGLFFRTKIQDSIAAFLHRRQGRAGSRERENEI